jgi:glycosyltransferase involved in cell wall biosynthesis
MPLLEAFAAGTPVLCSNVTSLPEVGGDAILSCDPTDIQAMAGLMKRITGEESLRDDLVHRGKRQLSKFTWERSAKNLADAFERMSTLSLPDQSHLAIEGNDGMKSTLVSIVTPSYNQGEFIRQAIESVLNQTYPNIEYFVIDGGSTDDTGKILQSYGDRIKWISEPDLGQANAINKGFAWSNGTIHGFLNSDDVLEIDAIEKVVSYFHKYPECDLVYGKAYYIDEYDHITGMYETDEYSFVRMMKDCCICQPAAFWRKSTADIVGAFDENLFMAFDFDYWLRTDRAGLTIQYIPDILARSRLHSNTKTLSSRRTAYKEAFLVSQRHGGYVDLNYFYGLWNHLIWEKTSGLPHLLAQWPNSFVMPAKIHHQLFQFFQRIKSKLNKKIIQRIVSETVTKSLDQLKHYFGFLRPIIRRLRSWIYQVNQDVPVFGFWPDNWLGPVAQFYIRSSTPGPFFLEGIPIVDMDVQLRVNRQKIINKKIIGNTHTRLEISAKLGDRISLSFSKPVLDSSVRYITFLVQGTNLFTEEDPIS